MKIKYKVALYTSEIPYDEPIEDVEFDVDVTIPFNYGDKESYELANIIARISIQRIQRENEDRSKEDRAYAR